MFTNLKRPAVIMLLTAVFLCTSCIPAFAQGQTQSSGTIKVNVKTTYKQTTARNMLKLINNFRTGPNAWAWDENNATKVRYSNLKPLVYDYKLEKAAMKRAAELALSYDHYRPNGEDCFTAYQENGITVLYSAGENIAIGYNSFATTESVFKAWQETNEKYSGQGHRRNMLSSAFTAVGVGHAVFGNVHCWVQEFMNPPTNTKATSAVNTQKTVPITVSQNLITSGSSVTASTKSYTIPRGKSVKLPVLKANLRLSNTWGGVPQGAVSMTVPCKWKVVNGTYAAISGSNLVGKKAGTAKLQTTVQLKTAKTVSIPVKVVDKPKQVSNVKAVAGKKRITVSWKRDTKANGYQIVAAQNSKFTKGKKTVTVKTGKTVKTALKSLQSKKTYYVKVRAYKNTSKGKLYGNYSRKVKVKVK